MIPWSVQLIWAVLLVVVYLALPVAVFALHRLWRSARSIEIYFREMADAGEGIGRGTGTLIGLGDTIHGASQLLETAGALEKDAKTIRTTLAGRIAGSQEGGD